MSLICALLLALGTARGQEAEGVACPDLAPPPDSLQVAWISPVRRHVWGHTALGVVRVADLRSLVRAQGPDPTRTLQSLGLLGPRAHLRRRWKVTLFDVRADQLCRPVEGVPEGDDTDGLPSCGGGRSSGAKRVTGCGQTLDSATGAPGLDQFQIPWREASRQGFCVMPLERFLGGA